MPRPTVEERRVLSVDNEDQPQMTNENNSPWHPLAKKSLTPSGNKVVEQKVEKQQKKEG